MALSPKPRVRQRLSREQPRTRRLVDKLVDTKARVGKQGLRQARPHSRHHPTPTQTRPTRPPPFRVRQGPTARPLDPRETPVLLLLFPCSPQLVTIPIRVSMTPPRDSMPIPLREWAVPRAPSAPLPLLHPAARYQPS